MDDGSIQPARILPLQPGVVACPSVWPHAHFLLQEAGQVAKRVDPFLWFLSNRAWSAPPVTDETLEVHYIGRAVNKALTYTARDRFRSGHAKLEAIEAELLTSRPNRLLYVLLGRLQCFEESRSGSRIPVPIDREIVWGLEARMLRWFRPSHNDRYADAYTRHIMKRYDAIEVDLLTPALRLTSDGQTAWGPFGLKNP